MIQYAAQGVLGIVTLQRPLNGLADGDAQAAGTVGTGLEHGPPRGGLIAGAGDAGRAECFHEGAPIGLLVIADLDHEHFDLQPEQRSGQRQRRAPLARAGFRGDALYALFLRVEGLGHGGVRLVAAGRADAFVLVIDAGGRIQRLFQAPGTVQRRGPPLPQDVPYRFGDIDIAFAADFLLDNSHREQGGQVIRGNRLPRARMQHRRGCFGQIGDDVIPGPGQVLFVQLVLHGVGHDVFPVTYCGLLDCNRMGLVLADGVFSTRRLPKLGKIRFTDACTYPRKPTQPLKPFRAFLVRFSSFFSDFLVSLSIRCSCSSGNQFSTMGRSTRSKPK